MGNFKNNVSIKFNIIGGSSNFDPARTVTIFGKRTLTDGKIVFPINGSAPLNPFVPFRLGAFPDGFSACAFLKQLGLRFELGKSFTQDFNAPTAVGLPLSDGSITLTWNGIPPNFTNLIGIGLTGTVTQATSTATGSIKSVSINNLTNQAFLRVLPTSGTFNTTNIITVSGINNTIQRPDPTRSDDIIVSVFNFYNAQTTPLPAPLNPPSALISILNEDCTTITPTSTPIILGDPTTVAIQPDNSVNLIYPNNIDNAGNLPNIPFGNSTVTQATSTATGLYNGYTFGAGNTIIINVTNVIGTFNTTDPVSVALDEVHSVFDYLNSTETNWFVLPFEIKTLTDLTNTHNIFYSKINEYSTGLGANSLKFQAVGVFANLTPKSQVYSLPNFNNDNFYGIWKCDQPTLLDYQEIAGGVASNFAYILANTQIPYNSRTGVVSNLTVSSRVTSYPSDDDCNEATTLGWSSFKVNNNGVAEIFTAVTTLTTDPNTTLEDVEFRYSSIKQKKRWLEKQIYDRWLLVRASPLINDGVRLNTPDLLSQFKSNIQEILITGSQEPNVMIIRVNEYINQVSVTLDTNNPTIIKVALSVIFAPESKGADITVDLYNASYQFSTTNNSIPA